MTISTIISELKRSTDQQKIRVANEGCSKNSTSENGLSTTFDLRDFGRAMLDAQKNKQEPTQQGAARRLSDDDKEAIGKLDLSPEELVDETLLNHLRNRGKFKQTYTSTDTQLEIGRKNAEKTLEQSRKSLPQTLSDFAWMIERMDEKIQECEELKEKLDHLSGEFILAAYRANHWQAMYEKSLDYLRQWHAELLKTTHLRSPGQSLRS